MAYDLTPRDTTPDAARKWHEIISAMSSEDRLRLTFELSENLGKIVFDGIRHRHPDYTEQQISQAYLSLILNREIYKRIYPKSDVQP